MLQDLKILQAGFLQLTMQLKNSLKTAQLVSGMTVMILGRISWNVVVPLCRACYVK